jgi:hypothetical protein
MIRRERDPRADHALCFITCEDADSEPSRKGADGHDSVRIVQELGIDVGQGIEDIGKSDG